MSEVEEFAEKMRQVGAHKGTMVTRKGFGSGGISVAESYNIGLATLNKEILFDLALSETADCNYRIGLTASEYIPPSGEKQEYPIFLSSILSDELETLKLE